MTERLQFSDIPLPADKLILMDLDKTLLDVDYNLTDQQILEEIIRVQSLGWILGLSSDTPLEPMEKWKRELGLNGPIIAERGSVIKLVDGRELVADESEAYFSNLRRSFIQFMAEERMPFYHGDVTQLIRNKPTLSGMVDESVILIQAYRRCSLNFFGRKITDTGLVIDNELVERMVEVTHQRMEVPPFELVEDYNPEYGIYIVSPKNVNKREGSVKLMSEMGLSKIGMVGDSKTDFVGNDIAIQYAVGNAKDELKAVSDYVAQGVYTVGVIEILLGIKS